MIPARADQAMTQLDLPQVSLQRYVDLLRRKTWQVIPVSILGLLIGGFVALLIPRYYVADIEVSHQRLPGKEVSAQVDPMAELVDAARSTIPNAVADTIKQLGWPEAMIADGYARWDAEHAIRQRLVVNDENAGNKLRTYASIHITYKDRDGRRAAKLLNTLVEVWSKRVLDESTAQASREVANANERFEYANSAWQRASTELAQVEQRYGLDPGLSREEAAKQTRAADDELKRLEEEAGKARVELEVLTINIEALQVRVDAMPRTVKVTPAQIEEKFLLKNPEVIAAKAKVLHYRTLMKGIKPAHPDYAGGKLSLAEAEKDLDELVQKAMGGAEPGQRSGEVPNPELAAGQKELDEKKIKFALQTGQLKELEQKVAAATERQLVLAKAYEFYRRAHLNLEDAEGQRKRALDRHASADEVLAALQRQDIIQVRHRAEVPPKPTDPNIFVVALLGCVIGLGAAVGLILMLDVVRGTFKTIDDVERSLPLPVLGGMAHLESDEVRTRTTRGRRRATIVAGVALVLVVAVVTIWYRDPTRVPGFVNSLLSMLLGEG
jgi:capsular polysaccharide biosynthesis protein